MIKRETFRKETCAGLNVTHTPNKTIVLPFDEATYATLLEDTSAYKTCVQGYIDAHPELFPDTIRDGWSLYGFTQTSIKQGLRVRRLLTKADGQVWQLRPSFMMPYMTCKTALAEHILFLQKWAPAWALAHVFELDVMTIHRLSQHMGRYNLVGTTVKQAELLPRDLGADEKFSAISGERVYLATTVGDNCFLGASVCVGAGEENLTEAYRHFQHEVQQVQPDYAPDTVNTDGWQATMKAWRTLFPTICVIQCFLHAILGIRNVATKATNALYVDIIAKAWEVYEAKTKRSFAQRMRRLREWGDTLKDCPLKTTLQKLCKKKAGFLPAYDFPHCLRTSNMIDRLMRGMEKYLCAHQGFHGTLASAEYGIRSYCLLTNFRPSLYNPVTGSKNIAPSTPFSQLNGFTYHSSWLQNMLIATSRQEIYQFQQKQLG
jgi:hypothetical protein